MYERITVQQWMLLPREMRDLLALEFNIQRTGITEVRDDIVVTDGRSNEDLLAITNERMNLYIGSEETFHRAWEITIAKAHATLHPPLGEIKLPPIRNVVAPIEEPVVVEPVAEEPKTITNEDGATATVVEVTPKIHETKKSKQK